MRLRLRFWQRERPWLGADPTPPPKPPAVTYTTRGGVLDFTGRASPLEIITGAANASDATGIGNLISIDSTAAEPRR